VDNPIITNSIILNLFGLLILSFSDIIKCSKIPNFWNLINIYFILFYSSLAGGGG
jgi:hypothetical protein